MTFLELSGKLEEPSWLLLHLQLTAEAVNQLQ